MPNAKTGAVLTLMVALVATPFTHAEPMSDTQCQTAKDGIEADHEAAMRACDRLVDPDARDAGTDGKPEPALSELEFQDSSNAKGTCVEEANAKQTVALAELKYRRSGSDDDRAKLAIAKADAERDVAQQRCDELTPNANAVCINKADAEEARAKAGAD